jgi:hypothetical protein
MKLFGRSSGYYLFWTGFVYFCVGICLAFTHSGLTEYATLGFVATTWGVVKMTDILFGKRKEVAE